MLRIKYKYAAYILFLFVIILFIPVFHNACYPVITMITGNESAIYLPIIMYHEIKTSGTGKDVITPYEFESDLLYLRENNYNTVTMAQLIDYVYDNKDLPVNPIILTFDDGYLSTYKYAFPLLKEYDMKMVFSIIGKSTDDFSLTPDDNITYSHVTWGQLNEMLGSGLIEIQNHTYDLHAARNGRVGCRQKSGESFSDYELILSDDITKLQDEIKSITGEVPNTFAYPYGEFSENTITVIKKLGFKAALTCVGHRRRDVKRN